MLALTDADRCGFTDVGCHLSQGMSNIFESALFTITDGMISASIILIDAVWGLIEGSTTPDLTAGYIYEWAGRMFGISLVVIVAFLALQVITSILRFRSAGAVMSAVPRAGFAVLGTAASLPIIAALSRGSDALSRDLAKVGSGNMKSLGKTISGSISHWLASEEGFEKSTFAVTLGGGGGAAFIAILLIFFIGLGLFLVWAALLIRSMLLIISVVLAPIAIMGVGWEVTQSWFRTWASATIALIITKPVIVIVFGLGTSALQALPTNATPAAAIGQLFTSALMLALAGLSPMACFKLVDFLGEQAVAGQHMGAAAAGSAIASKPAAAAQIPIRAGVMAAGIASGAGAGVAVAGAGAGGNGSTTTIVSDPASGGNNTAASSGLSSSVAGGGHVTAPSAASDHLPTTTPAHSNSPVPPIPASNPSSQPPATS